MVIAGEASGDLHGGHVIKELCALLPELEVFGTGGAHLAEAGVELFFRAEDMAVIGFKEVAKRYSYYKGIFNQMVSKLDELRPDAVFLVDYAGFNLRFAAEAKKRSIPVIFYVAPQVWAWKKGRIKTMRKVIDHLIVLFPFEVEFFAQHGMKAHCFGHPLLDIVKPTVSTQSFRETHQLDMQRKLVALLPGSRENEIQKHLPLLVQMSALLSRLCPGVQFVYPLAPTVSMAVVEPLLECSEVPIYLVEAETYNCVASSDVAVVASGTATLETAILETPLLIFYKVAATSYLIGKYLLGIKTIGLPNIVLEQEAVPEMVQNKTDPKEMAYLVADLLKDPVSYQAQKDFLRQIRGKLGSTGAYHKTAEFMAQLLTNGSL